MSIVGHAARIIGGLILYNLLWPAGLSLWQVVLYWLAIILITEGGAWAAIRDHERNSQL